MRRQIRQAKLLEKLQRRIGSAQFEPQQIPDKTWIPILQAASMEDDETLQDIWANLLANAADPSQENSVHLSYVEIVKQLNPEDAKFLVAAYQSNWFTPWDSRDLFDQFFEVARSEQGLAADSRYYISLDNLMRLGLFERVVLEEAEPSLPRIRSEELAKTRIVKTALGSALLKACTAPKPSAEAQAKS